MASLKTRNTKQIRYYVFVVGMMLLTLFFAWTRLQNIRLHRDIQRLAKEERNLLLENNKLKLRKAELTSPKALEDLGKQKFSLSRPRPDQVIKVREPNG